MALIVISILPAVAIATDLLVSINGQACEATIADKSYACTFGLHPAKDERTLEPCLPVGTFPLRQVYIRTDKISPDALQNVKLRTLALQRFDGWCIDPSSNMYNQWVDLTRFNPLLEHQKLYRKDNLYDILIVAGNNDDPVVPGEGSVIFVHVTPEGIASGNGCLAFSQEDLLEILPMLDENSRLIVEENLNSN